MTSQDIREKGEAGIDGSTAGLEGVCLGVSYDLLKMFEDGIGSCLLSMIQAGVERVSAESDSEFQSNPP